MEQEQEKSQEGMNEIYSYFKEKQEQGQPQEQEETPTINITIGLGTVVLVLGILLVLVVGGVRSVVNRIHPQTFLMEQEVVRMPLYSDDNHRYFSYVVVNSDTIRMYINTRAALSSLPPTATTRIFRSRFVRDGNGNLSGFETRRTRKIQWGGVKIRNLWVNIRSCSCCSPSNHGVIGHDILRHFVVQFDNANHEIVLTKNSALIEKKGVAVSFVSNRRGYPRINLTVNEKNGVFLLESRSNLELAVDAAFFYSSGLSDLKNRQWIRSGGRATFIPEFIPQPQAVTKDYLMLAKAKLQDKMFENVLVAHNERWTNSIGAGFLHRFRTITIDYLNRIVYFELPQDIQQYPVSMLFSGTEITAHPIEYLRRFFDRYNSFGFLPFWEPPFTIRSLEINSEFGVLTIGDTLAGINQTFFSQRALDKMIPNANYELIGTRAGQRAKLFSTVSQATEATFHFLRDGEIITINAEREKFLYPVPVAGYSFGWRRNMRHFANIDFPVEPTTNMTIHFPWASLSKKEVDIERYDEEGNRYVMSNRLPE